MPIDSQAASCSGSRSGSLAFMGKSVLGKFSVFFSSGFLAISWILGTFFAPVAPICLRIIPKRARGCSGRTNRCRHGCAAVQNSRMPYNDYVTMVFVRCQPQSGQTSFFPALRLRLLGELPGLPSKFMPELNPHVINEAAPSVIEPSLKLGRLPSPVRESELKSFFSNLKEFFKPAPRGPVNSDLLVNWNAGLGGFWQNLKDIISPPKLPPLRTTSQPVAVPEIWSKNTQFTRVKAWRVAAPRPVL